MSRLPKKSRGPRNHSGGFTLLELIVAVSIMMIVAAVAAGTIADAFKLKASAERAVDANRDMELPGDIFVKEINCVPPPSTQSAAATNVAAGSTAVDTTIPNFFFGAFTGDDQSIQFYTTGLDRASVVPGDVRYEEFYLSANGAGNRVFVRGQRSNLLEDQQSALVEEVLATDVISVEFAYWDGSSWQSSWDSTSNGNLLPYAVGMKLILAPSGPGLPDRVIQRYALIPCAAPSTSQSDTESGSLLTGGLGQ